MPPVRVREEVQSVGGVPRLGRGGRSSYAFGGLLSFPKERGVPRPSAGHFWLGRDFPFLCLRRDTFFPWRKKVSKERHLRKGGFRFPPFLKNPFPLKRPKGEGLRPLPFGNPHPGGWAIIKSRLCRSAAKVGGGQRPPFEKSFCREPKNRAVLHFRAKAAAGRGAEAMRYLGEICTAQRSRGSF